MDMKDAADTPQVVAPSFRHTRPTKRRDYDHTPGLIERQVTVTNPDGSTTEHTFWSDTHTA